MPRIILPESIQYVISRLAEAGYTAYAVGGCVRDHLLGNQPKDYDVTTIALPEQTMEVFSWKMAILTHIISQVFSVHSTNGLPLSCLMVQLA